MMLSPTGLEQHHQPSRHQQPQRQQISRSISELSPIHIHRHNHGHGHASSNHHSSHTNSRSHSRRDNKNERATTDRGDDSVTHTKSAGAQSAAASSVFHPRSSLEVPNTRTTTEAGADTSATITPVGTLTPADQSRRTSALIQSGDEGMGMGAAEGGGGLYTRKLSRDEELAEERRRADVRASGLQKCLASLTEFSNQTTRRLDDSYYSVLSKTGDLQTTIAALKELALLSQSTSAQFERESGELVGEIGAQIEAFGNFEEQEGRIKALTERIHGGRDKVRSLSERVDVVRGRIEKWETADREWQERTRRRLKAVWVVISVLAVVVLGLLVVVRWVDVNGEGTEGLVKDNGSARGVMGGGQGVVEVEVDGEGRRGDGFRSVLAAMNRSREGVVDERLRLLDEL